MKTFKIILDIFTLILISILLHSFSKVEMNESIDNSKIVLSIQDWNKKYKKEEIYTYLQKISKKKNIQIYKNIIDYSSDNNIYRKFYKFNANYDSTNINKNLMSEASYKELISKDLRGKYFIKGDAKDIENITNDLDNLGVSSEIYKLNIPMIFLTYTYSKKFHISIISILIAYFMYYLNVRSEKFKEYAIKRLHGSSNINLIFSELMQKTIPIFILGILSLILTIHLSKLFNYQGNVSVLLLRNLFLYLTFLLILFIISSLSWLMLKSINIPEMIKGKKPYFTLRLLSTTAKFIILIVLVFLTSQSIVSYTQLKDIKDSEKYWKPLKNYYILELAPIMYTPQEEKKVYHKISNLVKEEEKNNKGILMRNNTIYKPSLTDYTPENGNVFFVNKNFIKQYNQIDNTINFPLDTTNNIDALLPQNAQNKVDYIKKDYSDWIKFQNSNNKSNALPLKYKLYNSNYKIFSYDARSDTPFKFLDSPLIVILNSKDLSDNFYASTVSQAGFIFKDFDHIREKVNEYDLSRDISGITNYTDNVKNTLKELELNIYITALSIVLNSVVVIFIILFDVVQYFNQNKKLILIKKINGYSSLGNHKSYLANTSIFTLFTFIITWIFNRHIETVYIFTLILVLQFIFQLFYINYLEKKHQRLIGEIL